MFNHESFSKPELTQSKEGIATPPGGKLAWASHGRQVAHTPLSQISTPSLTPTISTHQQCRYPPWIHNPIGAGRELRASATRKHPTARPRFILSEAQRWRSQKKKKASGGDSSPSVGVRHHRPSYTRGSTEPGSPMRVVRVRYTILIPTGATLSVSAGVCDHPVRANNSPLARAMPSSFTLIAVVPHSANHCSH